MIAPNPVQSQAARPRPWPLRRLETLLDRLDAVGARDLSLADARLLATLYRRACTQLLAARAESAPADLIDDLESVVARAHGHLQVSSRAKRASVWRFLGQGFPALVRQEAHLVGLAFAALLLGGVFGGAVMKLDPEALAVVVPEMHQDQTPIERIRDEAAHPKTNGGDAAVFSSFLFTHNIQVTFLVFALGVTFGIGTAFALFWNGVPLGALAVQYHQSGGGLFFWAWILPHGVVELTVVAIAGASGFVLARGLWRPGALSLGAALSREARRAVALVLGGIPMLVLAGVIEGTISQVHAPILPAWSKLVFAACLGLATLAYLGLAGRASCSNFVTAPSPMAEAIDLDEERIRG